MAFRISLSGKFGLGIVIFIAIPNFLAIVFHSFLYNQALVNIRRQTELVLPAQTAIAELKRTVLFLDLLGRDASLYSRNGESSQLEEARKLIRENKNHLFSAIENYENQYLLLNSRNHAFVSEGIARLAQRESVLVGELMNLIKIYYSQNVVISLKESGITLDAIVEKGDALSQVLQEIAEIGGGEFIDSSQRLYYVLWTIWMITLVWGLLFILYFNRKTFAPIERLAGLATDVSSGKSADFPVVSGDNEVTDLYASVKKMSEGLIKDVQRLQDVNKFKTEFLSVISHQLQTPLSSIKWAAELLLSKNKLTHEQAEKLKSMQQSSEQLIRMVQNLLRVSKLELGSLPLKFAPVDLKNLVKNEVEIMKPKAEGKGQKIILIGVSEFSIKIQADIDIVSEAVQNILDNALIYGPERTKIEVRCSREENFYVLSITNDGPAITGEEKEKIFTKFYRGQVAQAVRPGGSGLGLYVAKSAVEAHGGKLWFESPVKGNRGVTFHIGLPIKRK